MSWLSAVVRTCRLEAAVAMPSTIMNAAASRARSRLGSTKERQASEQVGGIGPHMPPSGPRLIASGVGAAGKVQDDGIARMYAANRDIALRACCENGAWQCRRRAIADGTLERQGRAGNGRGHEKRANRKPDHADEAAAPSGAFVSGRDCSAEKGRQRREAEANCDDEARFEKWFAKMRPLKPRNVPPPSSRRLDRRISGGPVGGRKEDRG